MKQIILIEILLIFTLLLIVSVYMILPAILIANYGDMPLNEVPTWVIWLMRFFTK